MGLCIHIPLASRESIHLIKKVKVISKIQFQSVGPLNKINILFSSLQLYRASSAPPYWLVHLLLPHSTMPIMCFFYMMQIAQIHCATTVAPSLHAGFNECTFWTRGGSRGGETREFPPPAGPSIIIFIQYIVDSIT